jgi:hypothetical protein
MKPINSFAKSIYSQCGEDGIIEEIFARISSSAQLDGWCVEFGALDGVLFSNTYNLIKNKGYRAVLIEGSKSHYKKLCRNIPQQEAIKVCQFVTLEGSSSLDSILRATPIPHDFDLLSIDIDGCDYHIFESLKLHKPKVVCIEFNPSIPNEIDFVQPADFAVKQGSSAKSIVRLARERGYFLAATTPCNLLLVREDFKGAVGESALEELRDDTECRTLIFFGYDGTVLSNRENISVPWHRLVVHPENLQVLPRYLRKFGEDYSVLQKVAFALFVLFRFPGDFRGLLREKVMNKLVKRERT